MSYIFLELLETRYKNTLTCTRAWLSFWSNIFCLFCQAGTAPSWKPEDARLFLHTAILICLLKIYKQFSSLSIAAWLNKKMNIWISMLFKLLQSWYASTRTLWMLLYPIYPKFSKFILICSSYQMGRFMKSLKVLSSL